MNPDDVLGGHQHTLAPTLVDDKTYYLYRDGDWMSKFIVRGYSTKPDCKTVLFSSAISTYINTANLTEMTISQARVHWSYLIGLGWTTANV